MKIEDREFKQLRGKEIALVKVAWGGPAEKRQKVRKGQRGRAREQGLKKEKLEAKRIAGLTQGQKVNEEDIDIGSSAVDNVGGVGGFTRSGRLFAPSTLRANTDAEAAVKAKGKQMAAEEVTTEEDPPKTAFEKEVDEFMRIIKKSDYKSSLVESTEYGLYSTGDNC
ncbi:hypothetical protein KIW84_044334 [Lathyrus oleraceus]|uniref:Uncharacterized protein n=1 Tax=Pisum sativum TaxID=3888 RepID=A0A9D4XGB8_PEA|nr:hypothetical protein KIW84_044334 [Pisum sativum]